MRTESKPIFQHYIPQFQLRYLVNNDGKLFVYDRKKNRYFKAHPKSIGGIKKFYTYKDKSGIEHNEIEDLNKQIETTAAPIIKAIHSRRKQFITTQEKADLSALLALNWQRTPAAKKRIDLMMESGVTTLQRLNALNKDIFFKQVKDLEKKTGKTFRNKERLRQSIFENRYRVKFDKVAYLQSMLSGLPKLSQSIQQMLWIIVILNEKRSFILSDVNFTVEQVKPTPFPYGNRGLLSPGSQSMCILTNKVAILMQPISGGVIFGYSNAHLVKSFNIINTVRSQRFIFSSSKTLLKNIVERTKLYSMKPEKIRIEVYSGPEHKTLRFDADEGLVNAE